MLCQHRHEGMGEEPLRIPHPCFSLPPSESLSLLLLSTPAWSSLWFLHLPPFLPRATPAPTPRPRQAERSGAELSVSLGQAPHTRAGSLILRAHHHPHISRQAEMNPAGRNWSYTQPFLLGSRPSPLSSAHPTRCIHSLSNERSHGLSVPGRRPSAGV